MPQHDVLIVMGDLNAKVGSDNVGNESCMGQEGVGERNNNGQCFANLCLENGLGIGSTIFQHKTIHKLTWILPDGRNCNQINHIAINQKWKSPMRDVRAMRGADASSDHHLVLCKLKLKLKSTKRKSSEQLFDSNRLRDPSIKSQFATELNNRFQVLKDMPADDINVICDKVQEALLDTSKNILGYKKRERK